MTKLNLLLVFPWCFQHLNRSLVKWIGNCVTAAPTEHNWENESGGGKLKRKIYQEIFDKEADALNPKISCVWKENSQFNAIKS